jgi:ATPase
MRPDYVIFDEIRKNADFAVYTDMRLAGVGMVGVIHATEPIEAIQRFISRVELGLIPSVIDTVIFIQNGEVEDVLSLKMTVKTPSGFRDDSLARPVIEVNDFLDGIPLYEIFSFGEQVVVIPLQQRRRRKKKHNTQSRPSRSSGGLKDILNDVVTTVDGIDIVDTHIERGGDNTVNIYMPEWAITYLYDERRDVIRHIEKNYNIFINFIAVDKDLEYTGKQIEIVENKKYLILKLGHDFRNQNVQLLIGPQVIMDATTDKQGNIKLSRNKSNTKRLERLLDTADSPLTVKAL